MELRLYKHYFLAIGLALILPALTYGILHFSYALKEEKATIESEALARSRHVTLLGDSQIQSHINTLRVLATSSAVVKGSLDEARDRAKSILAFNPDWKNILILEKHTRTLIFSLKNADKMSQVFPDVIEESVGGISKYGPGCPCIYIFADIPVEDSLREYTLAAAIDPISFQKLLLDQLPEGAVGAIVDKEGEFIGRTVRFEEMLGKPATEYVRNAMATGMEGIYAGKTYEGFENYTAFYTSPKTGWSTHIALASSLIDAPRRWSFIVVGAGVILALVTAGAFILYIMREFETSTSARLSSIVEFSEDAIISKNIKGIITSWNKSAEKILGYKEEEAVGQHISLIIPEDRLNEEDKIIGKIKSGERVNHFETKRKRKDGSLVDLSISVSPLKNASGEIIGASKVARDITERKHTEAQLFEERETLETLNKLAPALASNLELEKLIQLATDEATKLTGAAFSAFFYNVIDEDGKSLTLFTLSGAPKEAFEKFGMPRSTPLFEPTFQGEGTVLLDDVTQDPRYGNNNPHAGMPKGHLPVRSYLAVPVVSRSGEVIGGLFFGHPEAGIFSKRDAQIAEGIAAQAATGIDNARLYDQAMQGLEKAQAANNAKSEFLATMSHEIRTPMNVVVGLTSILQESEPLTEKQKEYIQILRISANSLLDLINDLLDISKIESATFELQKSDFSLNSLLAETVSIMSVKAKEKNLSFAVDIATPELKSIIFRSDSLRLRQVINNLCSNAIKFTETGGVTVTASSGGPGNGHVHDIIITVKDTGIGISREHLEIIFEKFIQADSSISRKYGGTGLGLSISQTLVKHMGGTLTVESEPGKGSIFTVRIPLESAPETRNIESEPKARPIAKRNGDSSDRKVLLVEDYEPNILVAGTFLEDLGYEYDTASNGSEAIKKAEENEYYAILMDIQMPVMNGFKATEHIRAHEKDAGKKPVIIIGLTAHALSGDKEKCLAAGMNDYLTKPFTNAELSKKLSTAAQPVS